MTTADLAREPEAWAELDNLIVLANERELTDRQTARLQELITGDEQAGLHYVAVMYVQAGLWRRFRRGIVSDQPEAGGLPIALAHEAAIPAPSLSPFAFFPSTLHGPIGYFSQGMPFAYLMATVVTGLGLLVGSLIHVSGPDQVARQTVSLPSPLSSLPFVVGRITGMVDCRWAEKGTVPFAARQSLPSPARGRGAGGEGGESLIPNPQSLVSLGDKFALAAGLMEITYNTGAKVILQGPVTYEAESNGGYLSVGKLTGKLEKRGEGPAARGEKGVVSSSFILHPSSFVIRTPTATVTDLGTEFGVEVSREGVSETHVFRGAVKIELESASTGNEKEKLAVVLRENESVRVEQPSASHGRRFTSYHRAAEPGRFVRSLPSVKWPLPVRVLAWFRLGEDDPGAKAGQPVGEKTISHVHGWYAKPYGLPTYTNDAAPGSSLAVQFSDTEPQSLYTPYAGWMPSDNFIMEFWFRMDRVPKGLACLVYRGRTDADGFGLLLDGQRCWCLLGQVGGVPTLGFTCDLGRWTHLALVSEQEDLQLWKDGQRIGQSRAMTPRPPGGALLIGGAPDNIAKTCVPFSGSIDNVRLSEFSGPFSPDMLLFQREHAQSHSNQQSTGNSSSRMVRDGSANRDRSSQEK